MKIALVDSEKSPVKSLRAMEWDELSGVLSSPEVSAEKFGAAWIPADIEPGARTGARVQSVSCLVLDVEAATTTDPLTKIKTVTGEDPPNFDEITLKVTKAGYRCILHTSHSHNDPAILPAGVKHPRYRIVFAVSRPLEKSEVRPLALHVAALFGLSDCVDKSCMEAARLFFLPRCPADRLAHFQHISVEGQPLVVDTLLMGINPVRREAVISCPPVHGGKVKPAPKSAAVAIDAACEFVNEQTFADLRSALLFMRADPREGWINNGLALKSLGDVGRGLWLEWSATSDKFDAADAARVWESFEPTEINYKAVFKAAQDAGWLNPAKAAQRDSSSSQRMEMGTPTERPAIAYRLQSGADLCNAAPMRWMVRGVLPLEGLAALYGASGSGKSFLLLDIAAAVAGGAPEWFGRCVTQAPVTYVCLEGEAGIGKRVKAWSLSRGAPVPDALQFITQPFDLLSRDVADLAAVIVAGGGADGLIILDTLNRAAPGADENSSVDMGLIIEAAKDLQRLCGGLVLPAHHTGKDSSRGMRGHSSLYAALDGAIEVTALGNSRVWSVAKSKDDVTGESCPFKLESVLIDLDDDGEEITSCVIAPGAAGGVIVKKKPALSKNQKLAAGVIMQALQSSEQIEEGKQCVAYDDALSIAAERMPTDAKHRKQSAKIAISGLVAGGYLGMKGDWLWII